MKVCCRLDDHYDRPLNWICTSPKCDKTRIFCSMCLKVFHKECLDYTVEIDDINRRLFGPNIGWIQDNTIANAITSIEKHKLTGHKEQLVGILGKLVEKEFTKITDFFMAKIEETKIKVLENVKQLSQEGDMVIDEFTTKLKSLYNFDTFLGILEPLKLDETDINDISQKLDIFFQQINSQQDHQKELRVMARKIISLTKNCFEGDKDLFDKFKDSIQFDIFDSYPSKAISQWAWSESPSAKSSTILLKGDSWITKKEKIPKGFTAVLGDTELSTGIWKWEIEVSSGRIDHEWVYFGIMEPRLAGDIENVHYSKGMGLTTSGYFCGVEKVNNLGEYDNKRYLCVLDMNEGTFTISSDGLLICKEKDSLKGKTYVPFATLYYSGNTAKLKTIA